MAGFSNTFFQLYLKNRGARKEGSRWQGGQVVWGMEKCVSASGKTKTKQKLAAFLQLLKYTTAAHLCLPVSLLPDDKHISFFLRV